METKINFDFIAELEGGSILKGYVPDAENSKSGVTIARGFDIGQRSPEELNRMLDTELAAKLSIYCHATKFKAVELLEKYPLEITQEEADQINHAVESEIVSRLTRNYYHDSMVQFDQLPEPMQTVIASVAFVYGSDLARRCPKFWKAATDCNPMAMYKELRNFGDAYPARRNKEADYLKAAL